MSHPDLSKATQLLQGLIAIQSFSGEEAETAAVLAEAAAEMGLSPKRMGNNVVILDPAWDDQKPCLLLCSHHDTVRPNKGYTRDPFAAEIENGRLYGLGSNDAGACLVSLLYAFAKLTALRDRSHNLIFAGVAEEENSGAGGIRAVLPQLPKLDLAVIGEPTGLALAIAEKGLLVLDGKVLGVPGHAAHSHTVNPVPLAAADVARLDGYRFTKVSKQLGEVRTSVTQFSAGTQHNVVPAEANFVVDVRVTDCYTNEEVLAELRDCVVHSELEPRSLRHGSSGIAADHPLVQAGCALGKTTYGSPTLSDQAALSCPSVKCGPGESSRSHQADEYIELAELAAGLEFYTTWLTKFLSR